MDRRAHQLVPVKNPRFFGPAFHSWFALAAAILVVAGCKNTDGSHETGASEEIIVLCAASLSDVVTELGTRYERETGRRVIISPGPSGALRRQIERGAPADVFLSADRAQLDALVDRGFVSSDAVRVIAGNRLVIAVPRDSGTAIADPRALLDARVTRVVLASPDYAPVGRYAGQALTTLGLWDSLQPKIVFVDDARAALHTIATGAADAGVIYATDVRSETRVRIACAFPADTHDTIAYVGATVDSKVGAPFLQFLSAPQNESVWTAHGFTPPDETSPPTTPPDPVNAPSAWSAIGLSIRVSLVAVLITLIPGVLLAAWLARTSSRWRYAVEVLVMSPLVLPPVVTGLFLLLILSRFGKGLLFTWYAAVLASAIVGLPLLVRTARAVFESVDKRLGQVASTLGASPIRVLCTITLPLAWRGIVAGGVLAWARGFGEFGATIVVAGNIPERTRTLPLAIWSAIQSPSGESLVPWVTAAVVLSAGAIVVGELLVRRTRGGDKRASLART